MRGKHREMWQYIIDNIDILLENRDHFRFTFIIVEQMKRKWVIDHVPYGEFVGLENNYCFACKECNGRCKKCPIADKAGICSEEDSTYKHFLGAIKNGNKDEAIKYAEVIRDAWN